MTTRPNIFIVGHSKIGKSPLAAHLARELNLTAISGESATFVSGGEFPIPTGVTCQTSSTGTIGTSCRPAICEARQRRSPAMIS